MVFVGSSIGKYRVGRTIGEGGFAKVKLAVDAETGGSVAVKVIDKSTVLRNNLMYQEGGFLTSFYLKRLDEREAKYFYQLIDAVDYCYRRGVFHRDLKPENLLIDSQGDLKVSDFSLSVLRKPGQLLSTSCGSPCYVAPEVIQHKSYNGAAADVWSCGVILFELLAGFLPFQDYGLSNLYRRRAKISDIFDDKWFQEGYNPSVRTTESDNNDDCVDLGEVGTDSDSSHSTEVRKAEEANPEPDRLINAFRLIATCRDLDLSGLFQEQETLEMIKVAAQDVCLSARRMGSSVVKLQDIRLLSRSMLDLTLSAEVTQVTPAHCVVEVSKSTGDLRAYKEFGGSLWKLLNEEQQLGSSPDLEASASG